MKIIFGHRSCIADEPYHANAMTLMNTTLVSLRQINLNLLTQQPRSTLHSRSGHESGVEIIRNPAGPYARKRRKVPYRRINYFLKFRKPDYSWTRKEIAEYAGTTIETVARVLTQFEKDGIIAKNGRDFEIIDSDKLTSQFSNSEY
ncbi:MAG: helix-turn-helix domain-containing protein [Bdellovibrionales bacterium]